MKASEQELVEAIRQLASEAETEQQTIKRAIAEMKMLMTTVLAQD